MGCSVSIPTNATVISMTELKRHASTGDLVLFSGKGNISNCVRMFSVSKWSHVAVIYVNKKGEKFIWECSQDSKMIDSITGKPKRGARLVKFGEFIEKYEGYFMALRKLRWDPSNDEYMKNLQSQWNSKKVGLEKIIFPKMVQTDYTSDLVVLVSSIMNSNHNHPGSLNEAFCTQLTIKTLRVMCIAKPGQSPYFLEMSKDLGKSSYQYNLNSFTSNEGNSQNSLDLYDCFYYDNEYYAFFEK